MSEIRIAWCTKMKGTYSYGNWHPLNNYESLKLWVIKENKDWPDLFHWLENKENGKITNYEDDDGFTMIIK